MPNGFFANIHDTVSKLPFTLQPADWDDREYIEDPNDVKPEVFRYTFTWW